MPGKLQTDDSEILVYYIKLTADINFFVISWEQKTNNLHPYETVTQRTSLAQMASKIWIMYLIKQP